MSGPGQDSVPEALVNGAPVAALAIGDRGLAYGDGVFETIRCESGRPRWLARHLARLALGCARLGIAAPSPAKLGPEIVRLATGHRRGLVKVIVTRGVARGRGYRPVGDEVPTRIVTRHAWPGESPPGFVAALATATLGENPALAGLKHLNRLEQVLAQLEAAARGLDEVLMRSSSGDVVCGSMSNVFVRDAKGLVTPPIDRCGVAGIMRSLVLEAAAEFGMPLREERLGVPELARARAVFLTNVRLGIQPVVRLDGRGLASDPDLERLRAWIADHGD